MADQTQDRGRHRDPWQRCNDEGTRTSRAMSTKPSTKAVAEVHLAKDEDDDDVEGARAPMQRRGHAQGLRSSGFESQAC